MIIRNAVLDELPMLMQLYDNARRFMAQQGNPGQWWGGYPTETIVQEDICLQQLYVCEEQDHVYAAFALIFGDDPTYQEINGAWKNDLPYATLHRVASTGEKRGMVDEIVRWAFAKHNNLRGDTHALNPIMQRAFERNGFEYCGTVWVEDGTTRMAYHKTR